MYGIDLEEIDIERLRSDLMDEYGTAAYAGFEAAMVDVFDIQSMDDEEVVQKALSMGYDLNKYRKDRYVK